MKELSKESVLKILFVLFLLISLSFVQAGIQTGNSRGLTTASFLTSDEVFLKSNTGICNNAYKVVEIYIINSGTSSLNDVRENSQTINLTVNYQIPANTKIWDKPRAGSYDVIVDCDGNGEYHPLEPKTSFNVSFRKGTGEAVLGTEIKNISWQYDSENKILNVELLQIKISAKEEDIVLDNIKIKSAGNGDDSKIQALEVYEDGNNNGKIDEGEILIGDSQPAYNLNNGESIINLDYTLVANSNSNLLIVYAMNEEIEEGDFSLSVIGLSGKGKISEEAIIFSGLPINSNSLIVLPKKTCIQNISLEFSPNPVNEGEKVIAKLTGVTGCDNKTVFLRTAPCSELSGDAGSCILKNDSCEVNITLLVNGKYYACLDKNNDKDALDNGEFADSILVITSKPEESREEKQEETATNSTEQTNPQNATITGGVITEIFSGSLKGIFVLLEITLLLILIVLIIISVRLKNNKSEKKKSEKEG